MDFILWEKINILLKFQYRGLIPKEFWHALERSEPQKTVT